MPYRQQAVVAHREGCAVVAGVLTVRPWVERDAAAVLAVAGGRFDQAYTRALHALHGPPRSGPNWSTTVVAEVSNKVVGVASLLHRPEHPTRYLFPLIVADGFRRRGIGRALIDSVREARPHNLPLAARARPDDPAASGLLSAVGGRVYQQCPGVIADLRSPHLAQWIRAQPLPTTTTLVTGADVDLGDSSRAWVDCYRWVHEGWSPIGALDALDAAAVTEARAAIAELSVFALNGQTIAAAAWTYAGEVDGYELVCEAVDRALPNGSSLVAAVVAAAMSRLIDAGGRHAAFDGHVSDPHLHPVLQSMPDTTRKPVNLVEAP